MGGRFELGTKIIQAEWWDENETVEIRKFSVGDRQALAAETIKYDMASDGDGAPQMTGEVLIGRMNLAILERGIKSWSLKGPEGQPVPVTPQWIYQLTERDAEFILAAIAELNPRRQRTADEQESFRGTD